MSSDAASPLASTSRDLLSSLPLAAESPAASTSNLLAASGAEQAGPSQPAPRRTNAQVLSDQLLAEGVTAEQSGRLLKDESEMWNHNAWDNVEWDPEQHRIALEKVGKQAAAPVPEDLRKVYNDQPEAYWDAFYGEKKESFFKDRKWLCTEFPDLGAATAADAGPKRIVEIGCGPGNTLFPLYEGNLNPSLDLHGYDFSKTAVDLVRSNPHFGAPNLHTGVWSLASPDGLPEGLEEGSVDIAIVIFVTSALHPDEWARAVENTFRMLKPGGLLLFRDYGRHDMAQLRFKANRLMQPNLYIRGDKTRVYFFERDELVAMFGAAPATATGEPAAEEAPAAEDEEEPEYLTKLKASPYRLELLQLGVDRRLLLNRKTQQKMYRIWLQGRWRKPLAAATTA